MLQGLQGYEGYDAVRKTSGVRDRSDEGRLRVTGPDRAAWLQGLLTNDIAAVKPGGGCYAAYLTPQGRMISDVRVLERGDFMLLDVPAAQKAFVLERLTTFIIMEDVAVDDVTASLARVAVHGPGAAALLEARGEGRRRHAARVAGGAREHGRAARWSSRGDRRFARTWRRCRGLRRVLSRAGERGSAARADRGRRRADRRQRVARAARRSGTPAVRRGYDDGDDSAGSGDRGSRDQLHEGLLRRPGDHHSRDAPRRRPRRAQAGGPASRRARRLAPDDTIAADTPLFAGEKSIGRITSAAWSPRFGQWIAMGYVQRESAEPGTHITIGQAGSGVEAVVTALRRCDKRSASLQQLDQLRVGGRKFERAEFGGRHPADFLAEARLRLAGEVAGEEVELDFARLVIVTRASAAVHAPPRSRPVPPRFRGPATLRAFRPVRACRREIPTSPRGACL